MLELHMLFLTLDQLSFEVSEDAYDQAKQPTQAQTKKRCQGFLRPLRENWVREVQKGELPSMVALPICLSLFRNSITNNRSV